MKFLHKINIVVMYLLVVVGFVLLYNSFVYVKHSEVCIVKKVNIKKDKTFPIKEVSEISNKIIGEKLYSLDIKKLTEEIKEISWVENVFIKKNFDKCSVSLKIESKKPIAIWFDGMNYLLVDDKNRIIDYPIKYDEAANLIIIKNTTPPDNLNEIISLSKSFAFIKNHIVSVEKVDNRRWDIVLKYMENYITIKLPEKNYKQVLQQIVKLNSEKDLLKRQITILDARNLDEVLITP